MSMAVPWLRWLSAELVIFDAYLRPEPPANLTFAISLVVGFSRRLTQRVQLQVYRNANKYLRKGRIGRVI